MVIVTGSAHARAEAFDDLLALCREHVARSRTEPGCLEHGVATDADDPLRLVFFERWADRSAIEAHMQLPASRDFGRRLMAMVDRPPSLDLYDVKLTDEADAMTESAPSADPSADPSAPTPERFADVNGVRLCYDSFGDPAHPPLLLIMGLASQMIAWDESFCAQLAARGLYVLRFDNRDIGRSTRFDAAGVPDVGKALMNAMLGRKIDAPYRLHDMADDACGLLDHLGLARAHVAGASMGGAIAQLMAIHHPQRVRSLVSIMATSGARGLPPPTSAAMAVLAKPAPSDLAGYTQNYREAWQVLRGGRFAADEARDAERAARAFGRGLNPAGAARQMAAILASGSRKTELAGVTVPTLVIHGDADPLIPVECGIDVANTVAGAKLVVVKGMGHALPMAMWPQIVDAIAAHAGAH